MTTESTKQEVILASSSLYRKELLERILDGFSCISPNIDESPFPDEEPIELVARLAEQKALTVALEHINSIVIGSDQICVLDGVIFGKPGTRDKAIKQLTMCSGKCLYFYTSLCVLSNAQEASQISIVTTKVIFRKLTLADIESYIDKEKPFDCAGSFKAEGLGITLFDSIESKDPTALIGLPLIALSQRLREINNSYLKNVNINT